MEPLHSYNGEDYEEEHTKPHIVYRNNASKKTVKDSTACETSGKLGDAPKHSLGECSSPYCICEHRHDDLLVFSYSLSICLCSTPDLPEIKQAITDIHIFIELFIVFFTSFAFLF